MAYVLRFKSNAFEADSVITRMLNKLGELSRGAKALVGIKSETFGGNNLQDLYGINVRTFNRAMDWADGDFDQQIILSQWSWKGTGEDGKTRRKNGEIVYEPRGIVTGKQIGRAHV